MRKVWALVGVAVTATLVLNIFFSPVYGKCHTTTDGKVCTLIGYTLKGGK